MKSYSLFEVSKKLTTSRNTIKKWEKELEDVLLIPRRNNGSRYYTDKELSLLVEAKNLYANNRPKSEVKERLTMLLHPKQEQPCLPSNEEVLHQQSPNKNAIDEGSAIAEHNRNVFFSSLEKYKEDFLEEIKEEIQNCIQKDVLENIKQEIRISRSEVASSLSAAIEESNEKIKENMESLASTIHTSVNKSQSNFEELRGNICKLTANSKAERKTYSKQWTSSHSSSKEIKSMIEQLSKSNEVINKSVEQLHQNDHYILETLQLEREQLHKEIREREQTFQNLVQSFRNTAAENEKKKQWWHFW
ncbi:MerR family transcriptional regulator [Niallia sp. 01092]|uniref:MerR family transcriptional regulator n=1 Tax=unclassified Niallia TaxID=2837522 RepID=UPI003FD1A497